MYRKHNDKQWVNTYPMPDLPEVGSDLCAVGSLACDVHDLTIMLKGNDKQHCSFYQKCRDCLATSEEIQTMVKCAISFCNKYM